ncbi:hypothetical protein DV702_05965 [Sporosarcina sp. PTS2304]|uniref:hypothetical protein n=1 Tax=Sporosarcina sp. PTS2304 TaxID=2283194 RepID=UPI000E0DE821|nr:hypothetical protein [Sporosarcina sp. PTS2304]AXH99326.1 hypothetical protein DV702_05965 [Sporosarcina sp. PTS2304]
MSHLRNERGYALLLTIMILILFSILGLTMLGLSAEGIKRNEYRADDTQAVAQAEKGMERIIADINAELTQSLGNNGLSADQFKHVLTSTLNRYRCTNTHIKSSTANGAYDVCIDKEPIPITAEDGTLNELRKIVSFASVGTVDTKKKQLNKTVEMGAEAFPETMKYAVGTNISSANPQNGEGNLYLHGGSEIIGDIKVDGNLLVKDSGVAGYSWVPSVLPRALPLPGAKSSKLVLGKNMYSINIQTLSQSIYTTHINRNLFPANQYIQRTDVASLFGANTAPRIVVREQLSPNIGITTQKSNYYYDYASPSVINVYNNTPGFSSSTFSGYRNTGQVVPTGTKSYKCGKNTCYEDTHYGSFTLKNTNYFGKLASNGNVKITSGDHTFKDGFYIGGSVDIGLFGSNREAEYNPKDKITLDGPIYVDGDLTMRNAELKGNTLIYVNGNVSIRFSSLEGKNLGGGKTGTVIIFATGDISMSNISANSDTPSLIKGFFYSQGNIEMYGTGSNMKIEGGVSAKRIVFNAIRGRAFTNGTYESVANQHNKPSRLQVTYDTEIIENFLKLSKPEPIITKIDPAVEREREISNVKK